MRASSSRPWMSSPSTTHRTLRRAAPCGATKPTATTSAESNGTATPEKKATATRKGAKKKRSKQDWEMEAVDKDQQYPLWFALPLQPGERRVTKRYEVLKNTIYTFEQLLGTLDVIVNIRMTVVALADGGLFVHAPVAPTPECLRLMRELEEKHGPVKYIVLPTTAVEHKLFLGPFAKKFPGADVYAAPRQWSFPLNLPLAFLGLFPRKAEILSEEDKATYPWSSEFDMAVLNLTVGIGPFVEVAFFHKPTRTLLVTDTVFEIPEDPPEVCTVDPTPLLKRSRDDARDAMRPDEQTLKKGWWKTILFAIFFQPSSVEFDITEYPTALVWRDDKWIEKVKQVQNKLLVAPILQVLVFSRDPNGTLEYMRKLCSWNFQRIIPAHFTAPVEATPRDLKRAAAFLLEDEAVSEETRRKWAVPGWSDLLEMSAETFEKLTADPKKVRAREAADPAARMRRRRQQQRQSKGSDYPDSELELLRNLTAFLTATGIAGSKPTKE